MALAAGTRIGAYEITSAIGAGGMGEVYRANDSNLGRDVAIKVLPDAFADDADRLARFEREAKVLASLNHPHIAHVYGLERVEAAPGTRPVRALIMELVEGPTLADRIARGAIPVDEALPIANQIAEALEAAHEQGIIHRDLKPANVKVRPDGTVKVLDFGLAKALDPLEGGHYGSKGSSPLAMTNSLTLTSPVAVTGIGVILGTAAYMAPEQAKGKPVTKVIDIWAFGCVLFEVLTGKRAFIGEDVSDTLAAVLRAEPDWSALPPDVPVSIRRLLRRCLQRDRRNRLADIADARLEIDDAINGPREEISREPRTETPSRRERVLFLSALAAATIVALGAVLWAMRTPAVAPAAVVHLHLVPTSDITLPSGSTPQISPDGRLVAFVGRGTDGILRLYVRALDTPDAKPLAGTEGIGGGNNGPIWSPDSRQVAFQVGATVKKIAVAGGLAQSLCDVRTGMSVVGGAWSRDGVIILGQNSRTGLLRVPANGGPCEPMTRIEPSENNHMFPVFLPDGKHFLYLRTQNEGGGNLYVGALDAAPENQKVKMVLSTRQVAQYVPATGASAGRILFIREGTLFAQPFDADRLELAGEAVPLVGSIGTLYNNAYFSVSTTGTLVYRTADSNNVQLTWFDRQGRVVSEVGDPVFPGVISVSPQGSYAAFTNLIAPYGWSLMDLARGTRTRLDANDFLTLPWSPDERQIAISRRDGLYRRPVNGAQDEERLLATSEQKDVALIVPIDWSRDGHSILYVTLDPKTRPEVWALPLDGSRKPFPVVQTSSSARDARFSPDSRWVAYTSDESGRNEIYIRPFVSPPTSRSSDNRGTQVVSRGGVASLLGWRDDGQELWYVTPDLKIMSVELRLEPTFQAHEPKLLFQMPPGTRAQSTDGNRFLLAVPTRQSTQVPFTVVQNWPVLIKN
jgi:eukaryotic-like serine/threonine-protein kinase